MYSMYSIYLIQCLTSNKCYIGQTRCSLAIRLLRHKVDSRRSTATSYFYRAIRKYGESAFVIHPLIQGITTQEEADTLEIACIDNFHARDPKIGYNISIGGDKPFNHKGRKRTEESKSKYKESKLGVKNPQYGKPSTSGTTFKSGSAHPNYGHPHSSETIDKMKESQRKRWALINPKLPLENILEDLNKEELTYAQIGEKYNVHEAKIVRVAHSHGITRYKNSSYKRKTDLEQREQQSITAAVENKKLKNHICPDCGKEFEQVTRSVYGGHRKACLHWKQVGEVLEKEMGKTLDEILY